MRIEGPVLGGPREGRRRLAHEVLYFPSSDSVAFPNAPTACTSSSDFHLVGLPVPILVPKDRSLVRLRLRVKREGGDVPTVAHDVYPGTNHTFTAEYMTD